MIAQTANESTGTAMDIYQVLENMQRSMVQISSNLENQQNQILNLSSQQQALQIAIPNTIPNGQTNYSNIMRKLMANKYAISNFVPRDRHDIDFLAKMLEDYESGQLPMRTKEAWQEKVSLLNSVAENGWPATVEKIRESKANLAALISPRQLNNVYSTNQRFRIGNGYKYTGKWKEKINQRRF